MKTKLSIYLFYFFAFVFVGTYAQKTITGTVSDESGPLPGVNVTLKGTNIGAETDFDGKFTIKAKKGDVLHFSYVGAEDVDYTVGDSNVVNIVMKSGVSLGEIVIETAYDVKKTKPTTNIAVTSVDAGTIEGRPNANFVQTLQGQVAGLSINTGSGQPGAASETLIRGVTSISGSTQPLYIIDGMPVPQDTFRSLNPNEIATVSVLKDAGATAIYGNRGANGVIIITTKKGKYNSKLKIHYTGVTGFSDLQPNHYNLMDAKQQLFLEKEYGSGMGASLTDQEIIDLAREKNTDWSDVFFRTGMSNNHTLTLTSGGENVNTFTSVGYTDVKGILVASGLKRMNIRNNLDGKSNNEKFKFSTNLSINFSKNDEPNRIGSGAINRNYALGGMISVPYLSPDDYTIGEGGSIPVVFTNTPLFLLDRLYTYTRYENELKLMGGLNASYDFTDYLTYRMKVNSDYTNVQTTRAESPTSFNAILFAASGDDTPGFQQQSSDNVFSYDITNSLVFERTFNNKHDLNFGVYAEYYRAHRRYFGFFENGLDPRVFFPGDGSGFVGDTDDNDWHVDVASALWRDAGLLSYFSRMDYSFDKKYGIEAVVRRDASYRFKNENKWGTFYSVAGRWNIDKEIFMENSGFSMLKLRASYGKLGNQNIQAASALYQPFAANSLYLDIYSVGSGYAGQNSIWANTPGIYDIRWENTQQADIGLDFEFAHRRISGNLDVYKKITTDLFEYIPLPLTSGISYQVKNGPGKLVNQGVELNLSTVVVKHDDKGFNLTVKASGNYNKMNRWGSDDSTVEEGGKFGQYYLVRYAGVNPTDGNLMFYDKDGNLTEEPDFDNDRVFTNKNRFPDYQGGFSLDADYHDFFFTAQFTYAIGIDRFDWNYQGFLDPSAIGQFRHSQDILNHWTPDNPYTNIPDLHASNISYSGNATDMFVFSGDYLRLRFVSLGYNFTKELLSKTGISSAKIFVNAENYFTLTPWRGFDVESASASAQWQYPTPRILAVG